MTARRLTRLATLGVLAGLALSPTAAAYAAPASAGHGHAAPAPHKRATGMPVASPAKPVRLVQLVGVVTAVDPTSTTLGVRLAGPRQVVVTLVVPATVPVQKDGVVGTLAGLAVGDHLTAKASLTGIVLTALRVQAASPDVTDPSDPAPGHPGTGDTDTPAPLPSPQPSPSS